MAVHASIYADQVAENGVGSLRANVDVGQGVALQIKAADTLHRGSTIIISRWCHQDEVSGQSLFDFGPMLVLDIIEEGALKLLTSSSAGETRRTLAPQAAAGRDGAENKYENECAVAHGADCSRRKRISVHQHVSKVSVGAPLFLRY